MEGLPSVTKHLGTPEEPRSCCAAYQVVRRKAEEVGRETRGQDQGCGRLQEGCHGAKREEEAREEAWTPAGTSQEDEGVIPPSLGFLVRFGGLVVRLGAGQGLEWGLALVVFSPVKVNWL